MAVYILIFNVHFAPDSEIEYAPLHLNSACYYKNALCALYSVKNTGCIQENVKPKYAKWAKPIKITLKE